MRIGLIGAGAIAQRHVDILAPHAGANVVALCDRDPERARRMAEHSGAHPYTEWEQMLAGERLDAVFVCTPPAAHAAPAVAALGQGLPVYVEKPLARTLVDGQAIVDAWRSSGTVCTVGYQWRSLDVVEELRARLRGARPGMLISRSIAATEAARGDLARAREAGSGSWFTDPRQSGGILFELGSHDIDLQVTIAGPAASVQAFAAGPTSTASRSMRSTWSPPTPPSIWRSIPSSG
jgi:myo-inositol 2-dehydrogenase / D-chiro-inositol 1-dehydrogenase